MKTWLSGDHHFGHANIIKYCNRPFSCIGEMDSKLIYIWNEYVSPEDLVYYLGDFTLGDMHSAVYFFSQLNGKIHILGNRWHHDKRWLDKLEFPGYSCAFSRSMHSIYLEMPIVVLENVKRDGTALVPAILCHYAFEIWDRKHYGSIHFHGHSHGTLPHIYNKLDVGIDNAYKLTGEYRPLELEEACKFASSII